MRAGISAAALANDEDDDDDDDEVENAAEDAGIWPAEGELICAGESITIFIRGAMGIVGDALGEDGSAGDTDGADEDGDRDGDSSLPPACTLLFLSSSMRTEVFCVIQHSIEISKNLKHTTNARQ